jgi:hypothetical protein
MDPHLLPADAVVVFGSNSGSPCVSGLRFSSVDVLVRSVRNFTTFLTNFVKLFLMIVWIDMWCWGV